MRICSVLYRFEIKGFVLPKGNLRRRKLRLREGRTQSAQGVQNETDVKAASSDHYGEISFPLNRKEHRYREMPTVHK
jgi:hypothetical protein